MEAVDSSRLIKGWSPTPFQDPFSDGFTLNFWFSILYFTDCRFSSPGIGAKSAPISLERLSLSVWALRAKGASEVPPSGLVYSSIFVFIIN